MGLAVVVLEVCRKELRVFPVDVLDEFLDAVALLKSGAVLSMPLSKSMASVGKGVHELRLKISNGIYRVFYVLKKKEAIYVVHAFQKKTQKTPAKNIELVKKRIRRLG